MISSTGPMPGWYRGLISVLSNDYTENGEVPNAPAEEVVFSEPLATILRDTT